MAAACDVLIGRYNFVVGRVNPHNRANDEFIAYSAIAHAKECVDPHCEKCGRFLNRLKEEKS